MQVAESTRISLKNTPKYSRRAAFDRCKHQSELSYEHPAASAKADNGVHQRFRNAMDEDGVVLRSAPLQIAMPLCHRAPCQPTPQRSQPTGLSPREPHAIEADHVCCNHSSKHPRVAAIMPANILLVKGGKRLAGGRE
eukprot:2792693-Rhodomonas_salina.2